MVLLQRISVAACLLAAVDVALAFSIHSKNSSPLQRSVLSMSTTPNFNNVEVAKTGGAGAVTASQQALAKNLSLGAPPARPKGGHYLTKGGVQVTAHVTALEFSKSNRPGTSEAAIENLVEKLDSQKGVLLASSYEFPGRYARWSLGFVDPPLEVSGKAGKCTIKALNSRGKVLMPAVENAMKQLKEDGILASVQVYQDKASGAATETEAVQIDVQVVPPPKVGTFNEEERSRQPSLFSVVRSLVELFGYQGGDRQLGLYGAFGYDLTFAFEPIDLQQARDPEQRDLLLYLPDSIYVVDQDKRDAWHVEYDFSVDQKSTQGMERVGEKDDFTPFQEGQAFQDRDTPKGEFANSVEKAKREFAVGNLFEAVLSQTFREKLPKETPPSKLFRRLRARNPSPYGFFINLGEREYLVGASPEMFVRCEAIPENDWRPNAIRVETCPISGTVARGADALEDAKRVKSLMMNAKEESELTMCTDVDRNDKSRICEPGSVQVIGRRQIEMYSRLIHTVDHVEGYLRPEFDSLDAFLCHTWAVTVTGAPKTWATQFVEDNERSPRCWYGGAVGMVGFDGGLNTGLTLRTVRVKDGVAEVRAGATLLYDSNPPAEELETELKASAMVDAIVMNGPEDAGVQTVELEKVPEKVGTGMNIVLVDHEDSFVHTLGNYLRQTGAKVQTLRSGPLALQAIENMVQKGEKPDMVVLSPGPGNPTDFALSTTIGLLIKHRIPGFGVCLGLQGIVEYFGGTLGVLSYPMHGKPSQIQLTKLGVSETSIFAGLPENFEVARYHSLYGIKDRLPKELEVTALSEDGIVMGIQHSTLPFAAVQFHPESILTSPANGMAILENALKFVKYSDGNDDLTPETGSALIGKLEMLSIAELRERLEAFEISTGGTKSELIIRLALWTHKSKEAKAGRIDLTEMTVPELRELKQGLGLKGAAPSRPELLELLHKCLLDTVAP
jgi:anthranilate synthase